jgi:hypothetical protein
MLSDGRVYGLLKTRIVFLSKHQGTIRDIRTQWKKEEDQILIHDKKYQKQVVLLNCKGK